MSRTDTGLGTGPDTTGRGANRWVILVCAVLVQLSIGSVYAWSVFAKALQSDAAFGWSKSKAAVPFSVVIGMIFVGSYVGGRLQDARGPRVVAMTGGVIYAVGVILASFAQSPDAFWLLVLGYGVIGGFGLGMVYIVPIAMLQKWFPDKPGLITGLAVAGFGFGAVVTAPVGQALIDQSPSVPTKAFLWLGIGYLVILLVCTSVFRNPAVRADAGAGTKAAAAAPGTSMRDFTPSEAMHTKQWYLLTAILTMSVTAGISLIAVAAGTASDVAGYSATSAAALVGVLGLFNGAGRIFWGWLSDLVGKMPAFLGILGIQGICLLLIPHASGAALFAVLAALIYLCYGGAFGTMPSTAGSFFGVKNVGAIYGLMLIGWSIGGVVGPLLIASLIGSDKAYNLGFTVIGVITLVALVLPLITKKPRRDGAAADGSDVGDARGRKAARDTARH
ncbi:L-lactate MFS transporter [Terrabacter sp. 2RAF25]|uniref:L-lactate MFS transporter n=1 Tax=Terrabacter sp. 2RAF25 TaxID=3232998 RepID=UPI003F989520